MNRTDEKRTLRLLRLGLILGTLAVYFRSLANYFVSYDDGDYVVHNLHVRGGLSLEGIVWAFTSGYAANWHPLTWLSHMLDCQLFGLEPLGHHLTSLLLHIAGTVALFEALRRLTGALWRPALVAALFAWHPVHVESVAWIAERKDVLSALFAFLALGAYAKYVTQAAGSPEAKTLFRWCLFWFFLGLLSKPMVVTLPCLLLLLDYWPLCRIAHPALSLPYPGGLRPTPALPLGQLVREKIPFFLLTIGSCTVTFLVQRSAGAVATIHDLSLPERLANVVVAYGRYLAKLLWPTRLAVFYPMVRPLPLWEIAASLLALLALTGLVLQLRRRQPYLLPGWCWFLGTLVPVIGLVQVGGQSIADRYTYLPAVGLFIMLAWGLGDLVTWRPRSQPALRVAVAAGLFACVALTWVQTGYWWSTITLFRHTRAVTPPNFVAEINLATAYTERMDLTNAVNCLEAAGRIETNSADVFACLARVYSLQGQPDRAIQLYERALTANPAFVDAHYNLGNLLAARDQLTAATNHYQLALNGNPEQSDAHYKLGLALQRLGDISSAATHFKAALHYNPEFAEAHDQLAGAWMRLGVPEAAEVQYREAIRIRPDYAHAHLKLGYVLARSNKFPEAKLHLAEAIRLEPTNAVAHYNLGGVYAAEGDLEPARIALVEAARLDPSDPETQVRLAAVLAREGHTDQSLETSRKAASLLIQQGRYEDAIRTLREALKSRPDAPEMLANLAWLLATSPEAKARNGAEAVALAEKVCLLGGRTDPRLLSPLDAAYAEAGRFPEALKAVGETIAAATATKQDAILQAATKRLALYQAGTSFHLNPPAAPVVKPKD